MAHIPANLRSRVQSYPLSAASFTGSYAIDFGGVESLVLLEAWATGHAQISLQFFNGSSIDYHR